MNVFDKITLRHLRRNRGRTVITILGIVLSVAMVCAVSGYFYSFYDFGYRGIIASTGDHHIIFLGVSEETANALAADDRFDPEYTKIEEHNELRPWGGGMTSFMYDEQVLEEDVPTENLKDVIVRFKSTNFRFYDETSDISQKYFQGKYKNTRAMVNYSLMRLEGINMNWRSEIDIERYVIHIIIGILIVIIGGASVVSIANSFNISTSERTKQFGLLKSVGASNKQIRRSVYLEGLFLAFVAIPIGIIAGLLILWSTLSLLNHILVTNNIISGNGVMLLPVFDVGIIIMTVVISLAIVLLSAWKPAVRAGLITPIDAIRQSKDIKVRKHELKIPRIVSKIFGFEGTLASKTLKRNKDKYRAAVVSLVVSIVLFTSVSSLINMLTHYADLEFGTSDHNVEAWLSVSKWGFNDPDNVDDADVLKLRNEVKERVEEFLSSRDDLTFKLNRYILLIAEFARDYVMSGWGPNQPRGFYTEDFVKWKSEGDRGSSYSSDTLIPIPDEEFERLAPGAKGDVPAVLINVSGSTRLGGRIQTFKVLDIPVGTEVKMEESGGWGFDNKPSTILTVAGELDYYPEYASPGRYWNGALTWLLPESVFEQLVPVHGGSFTDFIITADNADLIVEELLMLFEDGDSFYYMGSYHGRTIYVRNIEAQERESRTITFIIALFGYGFIGLLTLIAVTSVISTISTGMALRRREFAMLYSVGMTEKGMDKMLNLESLLYGFKALLYGIPIGLLVTYVMFRFVLMAMEFAFPVPWAAMGICAAGVFLLTFGTIRYSKRKLRGINIVEAVRNEMT